MQKKYVSVNAEVDTDGVIRPLLIRWHDGRQWEVTMRFCESLVCLKTHPVGYKISLNNN